MNSSLVDVEMKSSEYVGPLKAGVFIIKHSSDSRELGGGSALQDRGREIQ